MFFQIFTIAIGANPVTQSEFQEIADATGGTAFSAANASEIVDALLDVINLPIYTIKAELSSIEEGDSGTKIVNFTISRDVADSAAVVEIGQSGTADIDDVSGIPSFVSFAEGETEKTIAVSVIGDTAFEIDETLALRITSVDQPATFGGTAATLTIQNDDNEVPNVVLGTESRDNLAGTDGDDEIRSLAGTYDKMSGRLGADVFVFGSEALNGARERDVILDYEPGVDSIRLEDGATVASIRETSNSVVVFLEGDGDAIYVRGTDVAASSLTIFNEDSLFV